MARINGSRATGRAWLMVADNTAPHGVQIVALDLPAAVVPT